MSISINHSWIDHFWFRAAMWIGLLGVIWLLTDTALDQAMVFHDSEAKHVAPQQSDAHGHGRQQVGDHDHATDHGSTQTVWSYLGKWHPVIVHFPIGLLLTAASLELLYVATWSRNLRDAATISLYAGALSAAAAAILGWSAGAQAGYPGLVGYLTWHRWLGVSTATLAVLAAVVRWRIERRATIASTIVRWSERALIWLVALLTGITGHLGGSLVYGPGHLSW